MDNSGIKIKARQAIFDLTEGNSEWEKEIRQEERTRTIEEVIEKIPSVNNPANAIMDKYREGENSIRKKILDVLLALKPKLHDNILLRHIDK